MDSLRVTSDGDTDRLLALQQQGLELRFKVEELKAENTAMRREGPAAALQVRTFLAK